MRSSGLARCSAALASAALAVLSFTYGDFSPLGQVLAAGVPGREIWLHGSALLLLVGAALCFLPTALPSVLILGAYEVAWAIVSTPHILASPLSVGSWYSFCEASSSLATPVILFMAYRPPARNLLQPARIVFGLTCVFYGYSHFAFADYTAGMVPTWLPGRLGFAYFTGLAHMAAGIALVVGFVPRLAATLEALMMSAFGLLVWVPSFFMQPRPKWATPAGNQWSELVVTLLLATSAWLLASECRKLP